MILKMIIAVVGLVGLLLMAFSIYFSRENIYMMRSGIYTKGKVGFSYKTSSRRQTKYFARVDFQTSDGKQLRSEGETFDLYKEGKEVGIYYLPTQPEKILIVHWFGNWWLPVLLFIFGLLLCYIGFAPLFTAYKS